MQNSATIVYRCVYLNGHEYCRLYFQNERWCLSGTAVFVRDNKPTLLQYDIECDPAWHTVSAKVLGRVGEDEIDLAIEVDPDKSWRLNDKAQPNVLGCVDIDLNFSPSTNLLPIRRLNLSVGQQASVKAAWLRFPSFKLEPLEQTYIRLAENTYRYESAGGSFSAELTVNDFGLVTNYPGIWEEEHSLQ
jgi:uncharacterized protein